MILRQPLMDTGTIVTRVKFHPDMPPKIVWCFEHLQRFAAPGDPSEVTVLKADSNGFYVKESRNAKANLCYGLAWRWP
jgi:hypothetical protein